MNHESVNQWLGSGISLGAIASTFMGWTPAIAAVVALVWYVIQIYESATIQNWIAQRRTRKIARLKARVLMMEAQSRPPLPGPGD